MATIFLHAAMGGASLALPAKLARLPRYGRWVAALVGAIVGALPDLMYTLSPASWAESHEMWKWAVWALPAFLHYWVDVPFHPFPGFNWGTDPLLILLEVILWLPCLWILTVSLRKRS